MVPRSSMPPVQLARSKASSAISTSGNRWPVSWFVASGHWEDPTGMCGPSLMFKAGIVWWDCRAAERDTCGRRPQSIFRFVATAIARTSPQARGTRIFLICRPL
jgi:hypothetical protein